MKIIFFGTGTFGIPSLRKLLHGGHELITVVTQPDSKKGRGYNSEPTPVKAFLEQVAPGVAVIQPDDPNKKDVISFLEDKGADIFVVVDYGRLLKRELLAVPKKYCVNLHPSLLPKYRGASPINQAILGGDAQAGNTLIKMDEKMDAGDVIAQESVLIKEGESAISLHERLSAKGAELLAKTLDDIKAGRERFIAQDESLASYAPRLKKTDGKIDWSLSSEEVLRRVRAMQPWPGAFTTVNGRNIKVIKAKKAAWDDAGGALPGTVVDTRMFTIKTGDGYIQAEMVQPAGKKEMTAVAFTRGARLGEGLILE